MRSSFSSSDQFSLKMKTKTNASCMEHYDGQELVRSIQCQGKKAIQRQSSNFVDGRVSNGISASFQKLDKQPSIVKVVSQALPSTHPLSPNSKRLQNQLQLFKFEEKIQQIQCNQIQQLINQQIMTNKQKQLQKISQLLNKSPIHPHNSNAFRFYKHLVNRSSKGRYNGNKTAQGYQFFQTKVAGLQGNNESIHKRKENKSVVVYEGKKTDEDNEKTDKGTIKPTASLPIWKQNIFHEKILCRQNQTKQIMSKTYFSSTSTKGTYFNSSLKTPQQSTQKLSQIQQSLNLLKAKSFSIKKNYEFFINKMNSSNPQVQEQLMEELNKSKINEKLLLDHNNKSFSGYCRMKSYLHNSREGTKEKNFEFQNKQEEDIYHNSTNITSYKFNHLKPLRLRQSRKNKNQLSLFDEDCPKLNRSRINQDSSNSDQETQSEQQIESKFHRRYKDKHSQKEIEKYVADRRKKVSREAGSPYHELSAWN